MTIGQAADFPNVNKRTECFDSLVLIAGSLFLVGEAKAWLEGGEFQASMQ